MSQEKPTVTISKEQHDKLVKAATVAELETQRLRVELEAERAKTETEKLDDAKRLVNALRPIVDHAIANLSPEFIVDLPAEAFFIAADHIDKVMGATQRDGERALIWRDRAETIVKWRERRKARASEGQAREAAPKPPSKPRTIRELFSRLITEVADDVGEFVRDARR